MMYLIEFIGTASIPTGKLWEALEAVNAGNEDVLDTTVLQFGDNL